MHLKIYIHIILKRSYINGIKLYIYFYNLLFYVIFYSFISTCKDEHKQPPPHTAPLWPPTRPIYIERWPRSPPHRPIYPNMYERVQIAYLQTNLSPQIHFSWTTQTLMLGKTERRRRRGKQGTRWLNAITDSRDMNMSKLQEMVKDRETWHVAVLEVAKSRTPLSDWTTAQIF